MTATLRRLRGLWGPELASGAWRALVTSDSISSPLSFPLFRARYTSSAARCPSRPWTPLPADNSANDADLPPAVSLRPLLDVCVTDKRGREEESPKGGGQASGGVGALTAARMRAGGSEWGSHGPASLQPGPGRSDRGVLSRIPWGLVKEASTTGLSVPFENNFHLFCVIQRMLICWKKSWRITNEPKKKKQPRYAAARGDNGGARPVFFLLRVTTSTSRPFPETTPCVRSRQVRGSAAGCFLRQYTVTTSPRPRTQSHPAVTLVCRTPLRGYRVPHQLDIGRLCDRPPRGSAWTDVPKCRLPDSTPNLLSQILRWRKPSLTARQSRR